MNGRGWIPRTLGRGQLGSLGVRSASKPFQGGSRVLNWVGGDYIDNSGETPTTRFVAQPLARHVSNGNDLFLPLFTRF